LLSNSHNSPVAGYFAELSLFPTHIVLSLILLQWWIVYSVISLCLVCLHAVSCVMRSSTSWRRASVTLIASCVTIFSSSSHSSVPLLSTFHTCSLALLSSSLFWQLFRKVVCSLILDTADSFVCHFCSLNTNILNELITVGFMHVLGPQGPTCTLGSRRPKFA